MKSGNLLKFFASIIICELAGAVGSIYTTPEISGWYKILKNGPVWTILFVLMGISLYLAWSKKFAVKNELKLPKRKAWNKYSQKFMSGSWQKANIIIIFYLQLALNVLWSVIFFGMHNPGVAFFELLMLWVAIIYTIINFYRVSKASAYLLLPYILWVSFAAFLNFYIFILN